MGASRAERSRGRYGRWGCSKGEAAAIREVTAAEARTEAGTERGGGLSLIWVSPGWVGSI